MNKKGRGGFASAATRLRVKGTLVLKVDPRRPRPADIRLAAAVLKNGGVLAAPTDTVYGLMADARNPSALRLLYALKGREPQKPLACLLARRRQARELSGSVPEAAWELMKKHWPGALTLIVPRADWVREELTSGLPTVGLRQPDCPWIWALVEALGFPVAASSANLSGGRAVVDGAQVVGDWAGKIGLIVDGGLCPLGVESTVAVAGKSGLKVLRQGALTLDWEAV